MEFPDLKPNRLTCLSACASFEGDDIATTERIAKLAIGAKNLPRNEYVAAYGDPNNLTYIGIFPGGTDERHLHFTLSTCDCPEGKHEHEVVRPSLSIDEMATMLKPFFGKMVRVDFEALYRVAIKDLPPCGLLLGCKVESKHGIMTIKQSSATFSIERGPVDEISWNLLEKRPELLSVTIKLRKVSVFDQDYLTSFSRVTESVFDFLVLGKEVDAKRG